MAENTDEEPRGELAIRTLAMPADTNPHGDIFGGWLISQMDIAGGITANARARGRVGRIQKPFSNMRLIVREREETA